MKIVVLDGYTLARGDLSWDALKALGQLTVYDRMKPEAVPEAARNADILLVNKVPIPASTVKKLPNLKFIAVTATGYDMVDMAETAARTIPVSNVPEYGTDSVAQFVLACMLDFCNPIAIHDRAVKAGEWAKAEDWCFWKTPQIPLAGKKIGIVGFGRIGRRVGELAHAFGMEVLAYSPNPGFLPEYQPFSWKALPDLFSKADIVTLHCPQTSNNAGFVNADLIGKMKPGAFFINTARGGLVDEKALAMALNQGRIAGAAVDVVSQEPISNENPLLGAANIRITPHIAWSSFDARKNLIEVTLQNIKAFLDGNPIHVVNACLPA